MRLTEQELTTEQVDAMERRFLKQRGYEFNRAPASEQRFYLTAAKRGALMRSRNTLKRIEAVGMLGLPAPVVAEPELPDFVEVTVPRDYMKHRADRSLGSGYGAFDRRGNYNVTLSAHDVEEMRADALAVSVDALASVVQRRSALTFLSAVLREEEKVQKRNLRRL